MFLNALSLISLLSTKINIQRYIRQTFCPEVYNPRKSVIGIKNYNVISTTVKTWYGSETGYTKETTDRSKETGKNMEVRLVLNCEEWGHCW